MQSFNDFMEVNADGVARNASVLSRAEYEQRDFGSIEIANPDPEGDPISVPIMKPRLKDWTTSVLVRCAPAP